MNYLDRVFTLEQLRLLPTVHLVDLWNRAFVDPEVCIDIMDRSGLGSPWLRHATTLTRAFISSAKENEPSIRVYFPTEQMKDPNDTFSLRTPEFLSRLYEVVSKDRWWFGLGEGPIPTGKELVDTCVASLKEARENKPTPPSAVDHPSHYGGKDNPYEAIKVIEAWGLGFNLGNTVKYISRAGKKGNHLEDLKKAAWYLNRELANLEKG